MCVVDLPAVLDVGIRGSILTRRSYPTALDGRRYKKRKRKREKAPEGEYEGLSSIYKSNRRRTKIVVGLGAFFVL